MAQHSHSVYGNVNVHPLFQYQKNRASQRNINFGRIINGNRNHHQQHQYQGNNELSKRNLFKSTDILFRGREPEPLPFSNRNGKLHRSNPHLHFGGLSLSSDNSTGSSSSGSNKPSSSGSSSGIKTPSKWRTELSNAAHLIPKKWCDFVFRRNEDNKLYRSESFRFIQKTNSLALLPPLSSGLNKYRNKKLQVPVSDDYVEPLDHVVGNSGWRNKKEDSNKVTSEIKKAGSQSTTEPKNDENDGAYKIIKSYNAPYYYSDTIKEPTYCSPCTSWQSSEDVAQEGKKDADPVAKAPLADHPTTDVAQARQPPQPPPPDSQGTQHMARKRYETAFLPSSSQNPSQQPSSPDVDRLLLAIESSCSLAAEGRKVGGNNNAHITSGENRVLRAEGPGVTRGDSRQLQPDPSVAFIRQPNVSTAPTHVNAAMSRSTTTNSSPLPDKKPKPTMPLSEPLPQKKYSNNNNSSTSCSSSSSPSTSTSLSSCRPSDKRLVLTMMKDNSVSSLESIDSTKSEDLHPFSRRGGTNYSLYNRGPNLKLLSPISDKSPLEPISNLQSSGNEPHHNHYPAPSHHHHYHHVNAAELINVPWDMPKIRRRLALLADSGISLDSSGNVQSEHGSNSQFSTDDRRSMDDSHFQYTSSHIQGSESRGTGDAVDRSKGEAAGRSRVPNFHLNFDNGLVQDEYYEDPRYSVPDPPPKPGKWACNLNVTTVQVHAPQPPQKPDRCRMKLDFGIFGNIHPNNRYEIDPTIELEAQEWFHGAITRSEAEAILRATKEGSFLIRNCESSSFNRYSLSLKSARGFIHVRIEPNSLGTFSLGEQEFPSVPHLVLHFMYHRLPIKGAEHVKLLYPVITQLL